MKISRVGLGIIIFFISIAILSWIASAIISNKLEQQIQEYEIGTFRAKVQDVNTNLITGKITIVDAQLYDTLGYGTLSLPQVRLKGIRLLKLLINKKIALSKILIDQANISLYLDRDNKPILPPNNNDSSKFILKNIGKLQISKANLIVSRQDSTKNDTIYKTEFDLELLGISANKQKEYSYKSTNFNSISLYLQNGLYQFANELYSINYNTIAYNSSNSNLKGNLISLKSRYSKYEIGRQKGTETDWFDFTAQDIVMKNIRLQNLLADTALVSSQIFIKYFTGLAFKDKRLPFPERPNTKLPMALINSLPIAFHVDSVIIEDANIQYSEHVQNSKEAGVITFNNLSATIKNLSNIDSLITEPTTMKACAKVMGKAILTAHFVIPNNQYPVPYTVNGQMGSMSINSFEPILKHNASIIIKSGEIKQIEFDFQYDTEESKGNLNFEYQDLKVAVLNQSKNKIREAQSFLINNILLHKENIKEKESFRAGDISFKRDKKRSIFNYWWKSVYSGIKSAAIL